MNDLEDALIKKTEEQKELKASTSTRITLLGKRQRRDVKWVKRWVRQPNVFDMNNPIWT